MSRRMSLSTLPNCRAHSTVAHQWRTKIYRTCGFVVRLVIPSLSVIIFHTWEVCACVMTGENKNNSQIIPKVRKKVNMSWRDSFYITLNNVVTPPVILFGQIVSRCHINNVAISYCGLKKSLNTVAWLWKAVCSPKINLLSHTPKKWGREKRVRKGEKGREKREEEGPNFRP